MAYHGCLENLIFTLQSSEASFTMNMYRYLYICHIDNQFLTSLSSLARKKPKHRFPYHFDKGNKKFGPAVYH